MVDAPVVFPEYNTGKILSPGSIEAYRWYICGFSGCTSEGDSAERKLFKDQDTQAEHRAEDAKLEKFDTQNRCRLRRHGNQQRIARPYHTQIARREELDNPLQIFQDHEFGSIAAELLLRFLQRFGGRADSFVCEFATKRIKYCSLSLVCCRISQIVLWVLRLVPSSKPSHHSYGMRSSTSNNNVSEFQSLFKDECSRDSLVFEQDLECRANEDVVGDTVYEDKIFECSNTYNMSDAVRSTSEAEESTVHNLLATQDSAQNEGVDLLFDEPVELDLMDGNKESWRDSTVHPEINSGDSDDLFNPNVVDRKVSISKKPSNISRLCKNISSSLPKQILPPKMLAQEPSWALLSSEKCVQEVFDVALLMFDDIWKYMESTEACGVHYGTNERSEYTKTSDELKELLQKCSVDGSSPLQFDPLNFCLDVVKSLMSELIDMKLVSVDQLWNQWTLLRMGRQELVFESKLLLKLSRLSLLHSSTGREDSKTFSGTAGSGKLSVLSSLSSLLATSSTPRVQSTGSLSNREVATMLKQTPHEQYGHMLKEDRPATPPLCVYGESQILTAKQLKELRHVQLAIFFIFISAYYLFAFPEITGSIQIF